MEPRGNVLVDNVYSMKSVWNSRIPYQTLSHSKPLLGSEFWRCPRHFQGDPLASGYSLMESPRKFEWFGAKSDHGVGSIFPRMCQELQNHWIIVGWGLEQPGLMQVSLSVEEDWNERGIKVFPIQTIPGFHRVFQTGRDP